MIADPRHSRAATMGLLRRARGHHRRVRMLQDRITVQGRRDLAALCRQGMDRLPAQHMDRPQAQDMDHPAALSRRSRRVLSPVRVPRQDRREQSRRPVRLFHVRRDLGLDRVLDREVLECGPFRQVSGEYHRGGSVDQGDRCRAYSGRGR